MTTTAPATAVQDAERFRESLDASFGRYGWRDSSVPIFCRQAGIGEEEFYERWPDGVDGVWGEAYQLQAARTRTVMVEALETLHARQPNPSLGEVIEVLTPPLRDSLRDQAWHAMMGDYSVRVARNGHLLRRYRELSAAAKNEVVETVERLTGLPVDDVRPWLHLVWAMEKGLAITDPEEADSAEADAMRALLVRACDAI